MLHFPCEFRAQKAEFTCHNLKNIYGHWAPTVTGGGEGVASACSGHQKPSGTRGHWAPPAKYKPWVLAATSRHDQVQLGITGLQALLLATGHCWVLRSH